jgi:Subtilase family
MAYGAVFGESGDGFPDETDEERKRLALEDWRRVLEHPDVAWHTDSGGRTSLHRADWLVVARQDVTDNRLQANLDDLGIDRRDLQRRARNADRLGLRTFGVRLGSHADVVSVTSFLRGLDGRRPLRVAPDHLLFPTQGRVLGPGSQPRPASTPRNRPAFPSRKARRAVPVAVIDSGLVEPVLGTDPLLAATTDLPSQPAASSDPAWDAANTNLRHWIGGHGTHAAGVLAAAAAGSPTPAAVSIRHYAVTTFFDDPDLVPLVADSDLAAAVADAVANGCRVLNLSLGGPTALDLGALATTLELDAANSRADGGKGDDVVVVASAGNEGSTQPWYPAASTGVVAVGALTKLPPRSGRGDPPERAAFSNHGPWVDCATAGVGIVGPYVTGLGGPDSAGNRARFKGWAAWSGTSFAAPHVAGRIAAAIANGTTTSARVAAASVLAGGESLDPALGLGVMVR